MMKITIPPPLTEPPPAQSFWHDFRLILGTQLRVTKNKIRHWPVSYWVSLFAFGLVVTSILFFMGFFTYRALVNMEPLQAGGLLAMIFLGALAGLIFFGITAAFVTLYMSEDLEILFVSPVPVRAVFTAKTLIIVGSNFLPAFILIFLPGFFYGLLFKAGLSYYLFVLLAGLSLWLLGTAVAELLNLLVMRVVPPHRSREAIGVIGAVAGILIAVLFQIPNLLMNSAQQIDFASWLTSQQEMLAVMKFFPWGWAAEALTNSIVGNLVPALGWSLLLLLAGVGVFLLALTLVERGFRQGWVSLSQAAGGRRRKKTEKTKMLTTDNISLELTGHYTRMASPWQGMWAVAKKDLLYMRRDAREWFGYLVPLILMLVFIAQFLLTKSDTSRSSLVSVLIMYTIMFSGMLALQSFGREGEADWVLNSVPLAGWPVVWGKLIGAALPSLVLMEALLAGTAIATGVSASLTLMLAVGAVFLTLGASAIGLFYSINNARFNPENFQQRITPGATLVMYLVNLIFLFVLLIGLLYLIPPAELLAVVPLLLEIPAKSGFGGFLLALLQLMCKPLLWPQTLRIIFGLLATLAIWAAFFFGFMAATVRQSKKGFHVEIVSISKKKK